ncbi:MAG: N-acetyl sugar amidotransferase [Minwuia sp.]|uniref:N-acetyl sugar amidotransferase n=1 Tax=Minwuia sp. TaxID=2493630 RepID=UPI003A897A14
MTVRFCQSCVLPDSRPGIEIGADGVCNACKGHAANRIEIDWAARETELHRIVGTARAAKAPWDCIVPVSGGKDSFWQVIRCRALGMKVLAVTWKSPGRNALGQANLDALVRLGVDHIDFSIDPSVEARFMKKTLLETGSSAVPMHLAIFAIPMRLAVKMGVPLIVWGESPFMEYGGEKGDSDLNLLNHAWLKRHGILQGREALDWVGPELSERELEPYCPPSEAEFAAAQVRSIFLGYYMPWDPATSLKTAEAKGFRRRAEGPKIGLYDYADIDCDHIAVHHWFKWPKFGFTRLFDNLSLEIRNGRMSRPQALATIARLGDQRPSGDIEAACAFMDLPLADFAALEEKYRDHTIWTRRNGRWVIDGFPVEGWDWPEAPLEAAA